MNAIQKAKQKLDDSKLLLRISCWITNHSVMICSFMIPLLIYWLMFILRGVYPFGNGSVLVLDLNGQYVYFFEALQKAMHGDADLLYSWARSLGGEFTGIYAYYLASPLSWLVGLFSESHITEALLLIHLLKCGIAGCTMSFYLKKTQSHIKDMWIILFSTLYALSGYVIAFGHNTMWMDALMLLPLVIYGVEQIINKQKALLFVVTMTLTLISTFYIGYMVCLFVLIYFFYYYASHSGNYRNNYYGERFHFIKSFGRMGLAAVLSIGMAMVILLPTYYSLTFGKTTFSGADIDYTSLSSILEYFKDMTLTTQFDTIDLMAKMLPGGYDTVRPEGMPFLYCGLLTLLTLPLFFLSKTVRIREKVGAGLILSVMFFTMQNNITDIIWHCFQRPNWLNYRYSFMIIFLLVIFACRGAGEMEKVKSGHIAAIGGGLLGLIVLLQSQNLDIKVGETGKEVSYDYYCLWLSIILVIVYLGILGAYLKPRIRKTASVILCAVVCGEALLSGTIYLISLDFDVVISTRESYVTFMDRVKPIVYDVQASDSSFYRMEKTLSRNVCDNMALNMRGVSNSTSTLNATTINFLNQMGYSAASHWTTYKGGNPVADSLMGMKYIIYDDLNKVPGAYELYLEDQQNTLWAYQNPYALSLAYAANSAIYEIDMNDYLTPFEAMNAMITAMLGSEEEIQVFKPITHNLTVNTNTTGKTTSRPTNQNYDRTYKYDFYENLDSSSSSSNLRYVLEIPEDMPLGADVYFFFESDYPRVMDWTFLAPKENSDDEHLSGQFFENENDCVQYLGSLDTFDYNYALEVSIASDTGMLYLISDQTVFWYLDEAALADAMTRLAEGNFVIDADYDESHLTGTIHVPAGCSTIFTTIPYDEGWNVYVDGKQVEITQTLDALVAFDITEGEHTIELRYFSNYHKWGIIISLCTLALTVAVFFLDFKFLRPRLPEKRRKLEERLALEARREQERLAIEAAAEAAKIADSTDAGVQAAEQGSAEPPVPDKDEDDPV
ncbi:MAG: YfhO family protein [Clostridia bacterium]|nr:YfhO family protein [Clostridia bacterium]